MRRATAVLAGLLGLVSVPLSLSASTSWLALLTHLALGAMCVALSVTDGLAGRPFSARAWGAWSVVVTGGMALALHEASWARDGWGWVVPFLVLVAVSWVPPSVAWVAGRLGEHVRRGRALRAVHRRRVLLA